MKEKHKSNYIPKLPGGRQPAYARIYRTFRDSIQAGLLKPGQRVPSSRELAIRYGVSRITVTQAYDQLLAEGYFASRRGSGTFVATELPDGFFQSDHRVEAPKPSASRGLYSEARYIGQPAFLSGCADLDLFPRELWLKLYAKQLRGSAYSLNTYGHGDGGFLGLREAIAAHLRTQRGVRCEADQILILSGSQPGIELVARALIKQGDRVVMENPCYRGMVDAFRLNGAEICPIDVDDSGMKVEPLRRLRRNPRLVAVTPARQFPLGVAMPVGRQAQLLEWARSTGAWILEDDYDSEFRFQGRPLPAMQGISESERILYLGTFTRSMFPDLRIGYLVVPQSVYPDFLALWQAAAMNPSVALQATLAAFIQEGHFQRHLRRMRRRYAERCGRLAERIKARFGDRVELGPTDGGLHFVAYFEASLDLRSVEEAGRRRGYRFKPISRYGCGPLDRDGLMLGFSSFADEEMEAGLDVLEGILR